jgi:hypothetical protein
MPFVVFEEVNFKHVEEEEQVHISDPDLVKDDNDFGGVPNFNKIKNEIKKVHQMLINNYKEGQKYMRRNFNFSERNIINYALTVYIHPFCLHNKKKEFINEMIRENQYNKKSVNDNLTYDIKIKI